MNERRKGPVSRATVIVLALVGDMLTAATAPADHNANPADHPIPMIDLGLDSKAMVVELNFTGPGSAAMVGAQVVFGPARGRAGEPPLLRVRIFDDHGLLAQQFNAWDPRWVESENPSGELSTAVVSTAMGQFVFPFAPNLKTMTVFNVYENQPVGSYDLGEAIREFCEGHPDDPDCRTDLRLFKADSVDPGVAGETLGYILTVENQGPNPAHAPRVTDTLPAGLTFQSGPGCSETAPGTVSCDLAAIPAGDTASVTVTVLVAADLVYNAGAPLTVTNNATVTNLAGDDLDPSDNSATEDTLIVAKADLAVVSTSVLAPPSDVLIGENVQVTVRSVVTNHGPSSPMDAELERAASAQPGSTVVPAGTVVDVTALVKDELRQVDSAYTIACQLPGMHTFTFSDEIRPARPDDEDPNGLNNTGQTSLTVDCVVPVALNIKPGSNPNSTNLKKKGVEPLAVLTTSAGEYNLPLAFDATRILPLSVRWGAEAVVWPETGGSQESHGRGHVEDSYELDEKTRDGDRDMVLHFPLEGSGLVATDTEACVKGAFLGPNGEHFTFFGCDAIRLF